ncbi:hypothetical protein B0T11DRAFT_75640 [Plectosphaerella cucumerina]|uniref:Uncharacterized protein n=1 Tax=Plectosphaerella cucumerina TaxID=40658 RepID=A0A8K0TBC1_9PEZI|nr:hypothetical protein B0T11DRAFT_75640 [Plectosphaerella cucumerina]
MEVLRLNSFGRRKSLKMTLLSSQQVVITTWHHREQPKPTGKVNSGRGLSSDNESNNGVRNAMPAPTPSGQNRAIVEPVQTHMRTRQMNVPMRPGSRNSMDQSKKDLLSVNQRWNVAARDRPKRPKVDRRPFEADLGSDSQRSHARHLGLALDNGEILLDKFTGKMSFQQFMQGRQPRQVRCQVRTSTSPTWTRNKSTLPLPPSGSP